MLNLFAVSILRILSVLYPKMKCCVKLSCNFYFMRTLTIPNSREKFYLEIFLLLNLFAVSFFAYFDRFVSVNKMLRFIPVYFKHSVFMNNMLR